MRRTVGRVVVLMKAREVNFCWEAVWYRLIVVLDEAKPDKVNCFESGSSIL